MFHVFFLSGDVDFWVNGGWDQPNCGVVVNPLALVELGKVQASEGKLNFQLSCIIM
jgi:hypothetical protein